MKTSDQERADYETWVLRNWAKACLLRRNQTGHPKDGEYRKTAIQWGWESWIASVDSRIVLLPEYLDRDRIGFAAYDAIEIENLLEDAGVKSK